MKISKGSNILSALIIFGIIISISIGLIGVSIGATQPKVGRIVVLADDWPISDRYWLVVNSQDGGRIHAVEEYTPLNFESPSVPSNPRIGVFIVTHGNPIGTQLNQLGLTYKEIPHSNVTTFDLSSFDVLWIPNGDLGREPSPEPEFRQAIQVRRSELHTWVQNGGVLVVGVQHDNWQPVHSALDLLFETSSINYQNARQEGDGATIYPDMMEHPLVAYPNQLTNTNPNLTSIHFLWGFETFDTKWQPVLISSTGYPILMLREEQQGAYIALGFLGSSSRMNARDGFEGREQILENIIMYSIPIGAPTVTVVSPNGVEYWQEIQTITWTATDPQNDPLTYTVYYSPNGGQTWTQLATGLTEPSYLWDTTTVVDGTNYLIHVEASDGIHIGIDISDSPFEIANEVLNTAPIINVLQPNGGERVRDVIEIQWQVTDPDGDPLTFTLSYSPNGGDTWTQIASEVTGTSYLWNTSEVQVGTTYLIQVEASDGVLQAEDRSDAPFTVERETNTETRSDVFFVPSFRVVEALGALLVFLGLGKRQRQRNK